MGLARNAKPGWIASGLGCHQMPERSFHIEGTPMPLCARCLGCAIGQSAGAAAFLCGCVAPILVCFLFMGILLCDWLAQERFGYTSTNWRRLISGALGSFGLTMVWLRGWSYLVEHVAASM